MGKRKGRNGKEWQKKGGRKEKERERFGKRKEKERKKKGKRKEKEKNSPQQIFLFLVEKGKKKKDFSSYLCTLIV